VTASARVAAACAGAGLVWDQPGRTSLRDTLGGVAGALGAGPTDGPFAPPATDRAVVVLVDGLGYRNVLERGGHAPFLRRLLPTTSPASSTFPSTTATALTSFGTGAHPGQTGMLGYTVRNPQTGQLGNLVSWTGMPDARQWQRQDTWFERLSAAGVEVTSVGPARFRGSGLTEAAFRGSRYVDATSLPDRVDAALRLLRRPGLVYLYWGEIDKIGHHRGWTSLDWGEALGEADAELDRLARLLPRGAVMVVTADHGMVDVDPGRRWDVTHVPELAEGVALVTGEMRAMHLHLDVGVDPVDVVSRWREVLGPDAMVVTGEDAMDAGLLGPVSDHVLPVVGGVVVAMAGRATVVDSATQTAASLLLVGVHGSLTAHEVEIPMLVVEG
jgi:hypothetical protein